MISQTDRIHLLDDALARAIPESREWSRDQRSGSIGEAEYWMEVRSPQRPADQRLIVLLRHDGDIQVEYHIADKRGSPFEMFFVLPIGHEADAIDEVSRFIGEDKSLTAALSGKKANSLIFLAPWMMGSRLTRFVSTMVGRLSDLPVSAEA